MLVGQGERERKLPKTNCEKQINIIREDQWNSQKSVTQLLLIWDYMSIFSILVQPTREISCDRKKIFIQIILAFSH